MNNFTKGKFVANTSFKNTNVITQIKVRWQDLQVSAYYLLYKKFEHYDAYVHVELTAFFHRAMLAITK